MRPDLSETDVVEFKRISNIQGTYCISNIQFHLLWANTDYVGNSGPPLDYCTMENSRATSVEGDTDFCPSSQRKRHPNRG